jgi:hypothetical protein
VSLLATGRPERGRTPRSSGPRSSVLRALAFLAAASPALLAGAVSAQDVELERVWVPERAFKRVLARHPGGVLLTEAELEKLLAKARAAAAANKDARGLPPAETPRLATISQLRLKGIVSGTSATLQASADVAISGRGTVGLPLPLNGIGLQGVWVDGKPARVIVSETSPVVLLPGSATPTTRLVQWKWAATVLPAADGSQGSGRLPLRLPAAASASLDLALPSAVEVLPGQAGTTLWARAEGGGSRIRGALGGSRGAARSLQLAWRPKVAIATATPYTVARDDSVVTFRRGVTSLSTRLELRVFRAERQTFRLALPSGFVVRELSSPQGRPPRYLQRGDEVELSWPVARSGLLQVTIEAERPAQVNGQTGEAGQGERLQLRPVRVLDVDRSEGILAVAAGPDTVLSFPQEGPSGLERADLSALPAAARPEARGRGQRAAGRAALVRVYRHVASQGALPVVSKLLEPSVALNVQAALEVRPREVQALVVYRFAVQAGSVYTLRTALPKGYALEDALVRDGRGSEPAHRRQERALSGGRRELSFELEEGVRAGQEVLITLQCQRELPRGAAGQTLQIPRFGGAPASELRGLLGFAPDPAFRIVGQKLKGLLAIPAAELPRAGLDVDGLVLGYRVETTDYLGQVRIQRRETRVSVEQSARHRVAERVLSSDLQLDLDVSGAPVETLDLWLPEGSGEVATLRAPGLQSERERIETKDGLERWRLSFVRPWSGKRKLSLSFQTKLPSASSEGEGERSIKAELPRVRVEGAFRARGTLALFSEGDAELRVTPRQLRPIEVTEIAAGEAGESRPLFAFRWVRPDHGLEVEVVRPGEAPVLSAVAEHLALETSADRDGQARHVARFRVNNLNNQFFGLQLPEGAVLWSVVVDGQGVKPASQGGVHVVPIPVAGTKAAGETTEVTATYTMPGEWGAFGSAAMQAPSLLFGTSTSDVVPVLRTTWRLALPEDVQVLELAGNLSGGTRANLRPALIQGWKSWQHKGWLWVCLGIALPLLLLIGRPGGRRALLGGAERVHAGGQAVGRGVGQAGAAAQTPAARWALGGALLLTGVLFLGYQLLSLVGGRASQGPTAAAAPRAPGATRSFYGYDDAKREESKKATSDGWSHANGDAALELEGASAAPVGGALPPGVDGAFRQPNMDPNTQPARQAGRKPRSGEKQRRFKKGSKAKPGKRSYAEKKNKAKAKADYADDEVDQKRLGDMLKVQSELRRDRAEERESELEPSKEEPAEVEKPIIVHEDEVEVTEDLPKGNDLSALSDKSLDQTPGDEDGVIDTVVTRARGKDLPAATGATPGNGTWGRVPPKVGFATTKFDAEATATFGTNVQGGEALKAPALQAEGWQVGLRSLVLDLSSVGQGRELSRPGGGARLELSFVREGWLLSLAALFAFLSFLAGAFLPRLMGLSALSLICGGLVTLTLGAALVSDAAPLLNAAALGLVATVPLLILGALSRAWAAAPLSRLGEAIRRVRVERGGVERAATPAALLLGALVLFGASPAHAQGKPAADKGPGKVFVPFDSSDPKAATGKKRPKRVFLPREVYEDLMRQAFPERAQPAPEAPPAPSIVQGVDYQGRLTKAGLRLRATVSVEVLAKGWVEVPLGLTGTGLEGSSIKGGLKGARVRVANAGGYQLLAQGPGRYRVALDLVVPRRGGSFTFAAVPTLSARLVVRTSIEGQRLHVAGARAQQAQEVEGEPAVLASLGDARTVTVSLRSQEVLSAGASEASAETQSVVWIRRGRIQLTSKTAFRIAGAGREGFVFQLPKGLEVTQVQTPSLRAWQVKGDQLEVTLLRPVSGVATVTIRGEAPLATSSERFTAPQIAARGVSRERGSLGITADAGIRVRPGKTERLRQVAVSELSGVEPSAGTLGWAFGFSRRPCSLQLERVKERVEIHAETKLRASVRPDRYSIDAQIRYDVRRGRVYQVELLAPAEFALVSHSGLAVREVNETPGPERGFAKGTVVYSFGLASGLEGQAQTHKVRFVRRLSFDTKTEVPFPDLRPLGVKRETTQVAISTTAGLQVQPQDQPRGLSLEDVKRLTSGWPRAEAQGAYRLGYARSNGRQQGLAQATCSVTRPQPYQTGSWVLHARAERDVVRYTLRALYQIERAGVSQFGVELPSALAKQVSVNAENKREVRILPSKTEGNSILVVELQSPVEVSYDFALSWEEVLSESSFSIPNLALRGVDRALRGFVLVEKAPEVTDLLEEGTRTGVIQPTRAADVAALPPGKGAEDFVLVYQVPLKRDEAWSLSCALKAREVTLPAPAQVLWAHLESVFTRQGQVRHRIRYRVRNLRLQFLALELPPQAEVWSVFVADRPRRLHHRGGQTLVPLPKRSAADLSFDVELIYATPPGGELGGSLDTVGPKLVTERVEVQKTYWSVFLPEGFRYSGFEGNLDATSQADAEVERLRNEVSELARLEELARNAVGRKQEVADLNLAKQRERINAQFAVCESAPGISSNPGKGGTSLRQVLGKNKSTFQALNRKIQSRQGQAEQKAELGKEQVVVDGNSFTRGQSGWNYNDNVYKGKKRVWSNTQDLETPNNAPNPDAQRVVAPYHQGNETNQAPQQQQKRYVLRVQKGKSVSIRNAEVFQQGGQQTEQAMLGNLAYRAEGDRSRDAKRGEREGRGFRSSGSSEGLLSIKVAFATPGRAHHFVLTNDEAPRLTFKSAARDTGDFALRIGQGLGLILLLAALFRLGLHRPAEGAGGLAAQILLLGVAAGLAGASLAHPGGLALAVLLSLFAIRQGPLGASGEAEPESGSAEAPEVESPAAEATS